VTSGRVNHTRGAGFTLLELLVVMAIMVALTAAFPLALNRFLPARRVDGAARELLADIRKAQSRSAVTRRAMAIRPDDHGYRVQAFSPGKPETVVETRRWSDRTRLSLRAPSGENAAAALWIFPDGSSSGADFRIEDGQYMRHVAVSELTSRVSLRAVAAVVP